MNVKQSDTREEAVRAFYVLMLLITVSHSFSKQSFCRTYIVWALHHIYNLYTQMLLSENSYTGVHPELIHEKLPQKFQIDIREESNWILVICTRV